jgi:hypothetical protein
MRRARADASNDLTMALNVLAVIAQPADAPPFDTERAWDSLCTACESLGGEVSIERLREATEPALKRRLSGEPLRALFFIGHGYGRKGVGYATLLLEGAGRKGRAVNAQFFAALLCGRVQVVVLCAVEDGTPFAGMPEVLACHGVGAAIATRTRLDDSGYRTLAYKLLAPLYAGQTLAAAVESLGGGFDWALDPRCSTQRLISSSLSEPQSVPTPADDGAVRVKRELERKRAASEFDVFLCHNTDDKQAVKRIGEQLKRQGLLPWLDEWELAPGVPWQQELEAQVTNIRAVAVFVGRAGIGPWQQEELAAFLNEFHRRKCPVIPALLPDAPAQPRLPIFLSGRTWVDFRVVDPDPLQQLIWGITGRRPTAD